MPTKASSDDRPPPGRDRPLNTVPSSSPDLSSSPEFSSIQSLIDPDRRLNRDRPTLALNVARPVSGIDADSTLRSERSPAQST